MTTNAETTPADMSFEQAMAELEKIVDRLEKGSETLEQTIKDYERGEILRSHCAKLLNSVEQRIERIQKHGENITTAPFEEASSSNGSDSDN